MEIIDVNVNGKSLKELLIEMCKVNIESYANLCDQEGKILERHTSLLIVPQVGTAFHLVLVAVPIPESEPIRPVDSVHESDWPAFIGPDLPY